MLSTEDYLFRVFLTYIFYENLGSIKNGNTVTLSNSISNEVVLKMKI